MAYVLVNSKDPGLYYLDQHTETREFSKARKYATRALAEKVTSGTKKYNPLFTSRLLESITPAADEKQLYSRVDTVIMEAKDAIDSAILKIAQIVPENYIESDEFQNSNLRDVVSKLEKTRLYLVDVAFRPSWLNLKGVGAPIDNNAAMSPMVNIGTLGNATGVQPVGTAHAGTPAATMVAQTGIDEEVDVHSIEYSPSDLWTDVEAQIAAKTEGRYKVLVKGIKTNTDALIATYAPLLNEVIPAKPSVPSTGPHGNPKLVGTKLETNVTALNTTNRRAPQPLEGVPDDPTH